MTAERTLRVAHLYGSLLNLYGDRGNILTLRYRCRQRRIGFEADDIGLGQPIDPSAYDLIFVGGGPDREQRRVADDLVEQKGEALREAVADGVVTLAVCGGYQLLGRFYRDASGEELPGVGVFDLHTVHPGDQAQRCIGNIVVDWQDTKIVGFENHGGRTYLGEGVAPLGRVAVGYGNNGEDGTEGACVENAYGTYVHGSLLPKNPRLADHLVQIALDRRYGAEPLLPLDNSYEDRARSVAMEIAGRA
jgi:lipid II isoglutaminyl synthase (glutamine-hydrolysing)